MFVCRKILRSGAVFASCAAITVGLSVVPAFATVDLMPHRAIYDLELDASGAGSNVTAISGRMVYEFNGAACEGYSVTFRYVTRFGDSNGGARVTDLQASSFEAGNGETFQFLNKMFINRALADETRGRALHEKSGVAVELTQPEPKSVNIPGEALFPTQHLQKILATAKAGKNILVADVFDGSETGDKIYATTAIIGEEKRGEETTRNGSDSSRTEGLFESIGSGRYWPVTISYFENVDQGGEITPIYQLEFLLYDNGVSRRLVLDYGSFKMRGRLVELTPLELASCVGE